MTTTANQRAPERSIVCRACGWEGMRLPSSTKPCPRCGAQVERKRLWGLHGSERRLNAALDQR